MTSSGIKLLLFGSSYAPLTVVFFFLYLADRPRLAVLCLAIGLLCFSIMVLHFEVRAPQQVNFTKKVIRLQRKDGDVLSYIATYLIPFLTVPFANRWQEDAALLWLLGILALVYINSNMVYVNPTLLLLRYHPYEVSFDGDESPYIVLVRGRLRIGDHISLVDIADRVFLRVHPRSRG